MTPHAYILMSLPADSGPRVPCEACQRDVEAGLENVVALCISCSATVMAQALAGDGPIPAVHATTRAVGALHAFLAGSEVPN
jgi:hypothetical protein